MTNTKLTPYDMGPWGEWYQRKEVDAEIDRLRAIENAALRVASSRRDGIVTDTAVLDKLDAALEASAVEPGAAPWFYRYQALVSACMAKGFRPDEEDDPNYGGKRTVLVPSEKSPAEPGAVPVVTPALLLNVADWIDRGCDPFMAAKDLRLMAKRLAVKSNVGTTYRGFPDGSCQECGEELGAHICPAGEQA